MLQGPEDLDTKVSPAFGVWSAMQFAIPGVPPSGSRPACHGVWQLRVFRFIPPPHETEKSLFYTVLTHYVGHFIR